jgi:hypothetical protein
VRFPAAIYFPEKVFISVSGTYLSYTLRKHQGLVRLEGLDKLIEFNYLIESQTRNLLLFSTVPQPLCYSETRPYKEVTKITGNKLSDPECYTPLP